MSAADWIYWVFIGAVSALGIWAWWWNRRFERRLRAAAHDIVRQMRGGSR